jgi:hypothetical protein
MPKEKRVSLGCNQGQVISHSKQISFSFFFPFFFYYSYVHTRLGSFLPPAPTPSQQANFKHSSESAPNTYMLSHLLQPGDKNKLSDGPQASVPLLYRIIHH